MIRLVKPYVTFEEMAEDFKEILDSGILTKGKYVAALGQVIREYTGAKFAFPTTSATTALAMALKLAEVGPGDEVLVSDFSFPASVNVIEDIGARPVFVDVDRETFNVTCETFLSRLTPHTKAFLFVDALGNPTGVTEIARQCRQRGIVLIEDAACALGSGENGRRCGSIADITCFSLHPRKLITSGEGGLITTDNPQYADILACKLNHGADASGEFVTYGYNYRMPELACAMACKQIGKLDSIIQERSGQQQRYAAALQPLGFLPQRCGRDVVHNVQSVVFRLPEGMEQAPLLAFLRGEGIECIFGTYCLSECAYYLNKYNDVQPNAQYLRHHTITLPCYTGVPLEQVAESIQRYAARG